MVYFFTASILKWHKLLNTDKYKDIIISSLAYLVQDKRIQLLSFVIMPNHIHLIWHILEPHKRENVQRDFMKFTAQQMKFELQKNNPEILKYFEVNLKDRQFQIWQRNPLSVELYTRKVLEQKMDYIHTNPLQEKWKLVKTPEDYTYSSANFYILNKSPWEFITHYMDVL